jgi:uncharacterized membrane protein YgaE (UPF0421/DUF939 family)
MGRNRLYSTRDEAKEKQKIQIQNAEKRYKEQHEVYKNNVSSIQRQLVVLLNKNVINDISYLKVILETFKQKIKEQNETKEEETVETKGETKEDETIETEKQ